MSWPPMALARRVLCLTAGLVQFVLGATETWQAALDRMPLEATVTQLNRTNGVGIMLRAFRSNDVVKALIFMPGATDEFYFFRRARADLPGSPVSLLAAVSALTNQTMIRATFRPPFLLLHTEEDLLEPLITIKHLPTADKLRQARFVPHGIYDDRDWDSLRPILKSSLWIDLLPWPRSYRLLAFLSAQLCCLEFNGLGGSSSHGPGWPNGLHGPTPAGGF